jgi:transglutaminase-like putative cysteine protease
VAARHVWCRLDAEVERSADVALSVAVAAGLPRAEEELRTTLDGRPLELREVLDDHGTRVHVGTDIGAGHLTVEYRATVTGSADPPPVQDIDLIRYGRPSRYCESDRLYALARSEFRDLEGRDLLDAVSSWVGQRIAYIPGSSRSTDGAVTTLLSREGVCRDFAHLVVALLRGCDTPARMASVYAPGLQPMDFHAVAEAYIDGRWLVADATALAPRPSMVRIATGRDAADTAFLTSTRGEVLLVGLEVGAITDGDLPRDDATVAMSLR